MAIIKSGQQINYKTSDILKKPFDAQNSTKDNLVKEVLKDNYKQQTVGGTVLFSGIILEKIESDQASSSGFFSSFFNGLFGSEHAGQLVSYRVYIPEIHSGFGDPQYLLLPNVSDSSDQQLNEYAVKSQKVKSFPVVNPFFPADSMAKEYSVGDAVWIMFQNSKTLENGFILGNIAQAASSLPSLRDSPATSATNPMFTAALPGNKNNFYVPQEYSPTNSPQQIPPNMDTTGRGRFLIDYSLIIDIMAATKGILYRYGNYPGAYERKYILDNGDVYMYPKFAERCWKFNSAGLAAYIKLDPTRLQNHNWVTNNTRLEDAYWGVDCAGFVRKIIMHLKNCGILKEKVGNNPLYKMLGDFRDWSSVGLVYPINTGDQMPGDIAIHARYKIVKDKEGKEKKILKKGHVTFVQSYPVSVGGDSYTWGCQGAGPSVDGCLPWNGVGISGLKKKPPNLTLADRLDNASRPHLASKYGYPITNYYRFNPAWVQDNYSYNFYKEADGYRSPDKNPSKNIQEYKNLCHNPNWAWYRSFAYNTAINTHPRAVITAPDKGASQAARAIQIMELLSKGFPVDVSKDEFAARVWFWWGKGEGPGPEKFVARTLPAYGGSGGGSGTKEQMGGN